MHKSAVRQYRPDNIDLAVKKAELREAKKLVSRLTDDIEGLQKRVEEKKKNVESKEITEAEELKFQKRRKGLLFEEGEDERAAIMSSNKRSFLRMRSSEEIQRAPNSSSPVVPNMNDEEHKPKLKRKGTFAKLLSAKQFPSAHLPGRKRSATNSPPPARGSPQQGLIFPPGQKQKDSGALSSSTNPYSTSPSSNSPLAPQLPSPRLSPSTSTQTPQTSSSFVSLSPPLFCSPTYPQPSPPSSLPSPSPSSPSLPSPSPSPPSFSPPASPSLPSPASPQILPSPNQTEPKKKKPKKKKNATRLVKDEVGRGEGVEGSSGKRDVGAGLYALTNPLDSPEFGSYLQEVPPPPGKGKGKGKVKGKGKGREKEREKEKEKDADFDVPKNFGSYMEIDLSKIGPEKEKRRARGEGKKGGKKKGQKEENEDSEGDEDEEDNSSEEEDDVDDNDNDDDEDDSSSDSYSEDDWGKEDLRKSLGKKSKEKTVGVGQWNQRFQAVVSKLRAQGDGEGGKEDEMKLGLEASQELTFLSQDFIHAAKSFGKIIISEVYLPYKQKTIKPVDWGGVAGGQKYVVHEILFKFAYDQIGLFKGDNLAAAKVGGHELKGLMSYYSLGMQDVNFPMMALVDYRGFRLIAMSVLPLKKGSLIYGSCDAGRTVHADDKKFNEIMKQAGTMLNLKPHIAGANPKKTVSLVSPADLEGHKGYDKKYYLLDFSRSMPPVEINEEKFAGGHLYRLFRKNFVRDYPRPLCPDGFSGFCMHDPQRKQYDSELALATEYLLNYTIPCFVERFVSKVSKLPPSFISITKEMHSYGINLRYLGRVYNLLLGKVLNRENGATIAARLVLIEACGRVMKNLLYVSLQEKMKELKLVMEVPYRLLVIERVNVWFSEESEKGEEFWDGQNSILRKNLKKDFNFLSFSRFFPPIYPDKAVFRNHWRKRPRSLVDGEEEEKGEKVKEVNERQPSARPQFNKAESTFEVERKRKDQWGGWGKGSVLSVGGDKSKRRSSLGRAGGDLAEMSRFSRNQDISAIRTQNQNNESPRGAGEWGEGEGKKGLINRPVALETSDLYSLKKYLFYNREVGGDGKVVGWWFLFDRLMELTGLIFSDDVLKRVRDETETLRVHPTEPFSLHDLVSMEGRVKHMNTVYAAVGTFFKYKGLTQSQREFSSDHFCRAIESYEKALSDVPNDPDVLFNIASTYYLLLLDLHLSSKQSVRFDINADIVQDTRDYFRLAIENGEKNYLTHCLYAMFLEECGLLAEAEASFLDTLEIAPTFVFGLVQYALFMLKRENFVIANQLLKKARKQNKRAINPLTGKEVVKIFRVFLQNGTFTAVELSALSTAKDLAEEVMRALKTKAEKKGKDVQLSIRKLNILGLHFVDSTPSSSSSSVLSSSLGGTSPPPIPPPTIEFPSEFPNLSPFSGSSSSSSNTTTSPNFTSSTPNITTTTNNNNNNVNVPRPLQEDESPWVILSRDEAGGGEGRGGGRFVFLPLTSLDPERSLYEHYGNQAVLPTPPLSLSPPKWQN